VGVEWRSEVEGTCDICGKDEPAEVRAMRKSLVRCVDCAVCVHPSCFTPPLALSKLHYDGWRCASCALCHGCQQRREGETLLLCEKCGRSFHPTCTEQTVRTRKKKSNRKKAAAAPTAPPSAAATATAASTSAAGAEKEDTREVEMDASDATAPVDPSRGSASSPSPVEGVDSSDLYFLCSDCCYLPPMTAEDRA
jgi:hypothetical protein